MFARNLPGICSELGVRSEFARNSLEKRPGPAMHGTLQETFRQCPQYVGNRKDQEKNKLRQCFAKKKAPTVQVSGSDSVSVPSWNVRKIACFTRLEC